MAPDYPSLDGNDPTDVFLGAATIRWGARTVLAGYDAGKMPAAGDLKGLPPLVIFIGSAESLYDDSVSFVERARAAGVSDANLRIGRGLFHVWPMMYNYIPEADSALDELAEFVRKHVPSSGASPFPTCACPRLEKLLLE